MTNFRINTLGELKEKQMLHLFERAGYKIALDVGSGSVHILDNLAYEILKQVSKEELETVVLKTDLSELLKTSSEELLNAVFEQLAELTKKGMLYADDSYTEFASHLGLAPVKAMCLHIAHDCNLRCKYCFASTGGFGGTRKLMNFETAKEAIDLLVKLSDNRRNLEVDFFGGEPLMNFEIVKETVAYARSIERENGKNFRFTITTNGIGLNDDNIDFINKEMHNVVLSIDGRKPINDNMRPQTDGSGSYDDILPKFQKLVSGRKNKEYYVRGTYTRFNLDFDKDVISLYDNGFDQISVEPVIGDDASSFSIRNQDVAQIEQSYERLMNELIKRRSNNEINNFNFFHFMLDLENGPCAIKRLKGCGSGNEYVAVTPDGEIYPCHQFVGNEKFIMGNTKLGLTDMRLKQTFADANLLNKPECQKCWAKFFCSGGCNANNHSFCGSVCTPHKLSCELEKIRLECAIAMQAALVAHDNFKN